VVIGLWLLIDNTSLHGGAVASMATRQMAWRVCLGVRWAMITAFKSSMERIGRVAGEFVVVVGCALLVPVLVLSRMAVMARERARMRRQ